MRASIASRASRACTIICSRNSRSRSSARCGCASSTRGISTSQGDRPLSPSLLGALSPQRLPARDALGHFALELRRAEAEALAGDLVEERALRALAELAHPCEHRLVGVAANGTQHVRLAPAPAHRDDHHAELIGTPVIGERHALGEPAAGEIAAGIFRAALVDGAAAVAAEVARRARLHLVSLDHGGYPSLSTCRALPSR